MSLPKIIYVTEKGGYLFANFKETEITERDIYGIYELKEKRKMIFERKPMKVK